MSRYSPVYTNAQTHILLERQQATHRNIVEVLKLNTEKTELLWAGSKHGQSSVTDCRPSLQLGADTVTAQDDVRLLGVTISSDLNLQRHVSNVSVRNILLLVALAQTCPTII